GPLAAFPHARFGQAANEIRGTTFFSENGRIAPELKQQRAEQIMEKLLIGISGNHVGFNQNDRRPFPSTLDNLEGSEEAAAGHRQLVIARSERLVVQTFSHGRTADHVCLVWDIEYVVLGPEIVTSLLPKD